MGSYVKGEPVRVTATFSVDTVPTDPGDVTIRVRPFGEAEDTYAYNPGAIVRVSAGVYYVDVPTTAGPEGTWYYRTEGTAPAEGVAEGNFLVSSAF